MIHKTKLHEKNARRSAEIREAILSALADGREHNVRDVSSACGVAVPNLSRFLIGLRLDMAEARDPMKIDKIRRGHSSFLKLVKR